MTNSDQTSPKAPNSEVSGASAKKQWKVESPEKKSALPVLLVVGCAAFAVFALLVVGILAAIAIPNFISMALRAKRAEAPINLDAIRTAEIAYYGEFQEYFSVEPCPSSAPGRQQIPFEGECADSFRSFGWSPEGLMTRCQYSAQAIPGGEGDFKLIARCDGDGDGVEAVYEASRDSRATMVTSNNIY